MPRQRLLPQHGGCWFCCEDRCDAFDTEWDTFLHLQCLRDALAKDPGHPEARHMTYLLSAPSEPNA